MIGIHSCIVEHFYMFHFLYLQTFDVYYITTAQTKVYAIGTYQDFKIGHEYTLSISVKVKQKK